MPNFSAIPSKFAKADDFGTTQPIDIAHDPVSTTPDSDDLDAGFSDVLTRERVMTRCAWIIRYGPVVPGHPVATLGCVAITTNDSGLCPVHMRADRSHETTRRARRIIRRRRTAATFPLLDAIASDGAKTE